MTKQKKNLQKPNMGEIIVIDVEKLLLFVEKDIALSFRALSNHKVNFQIMLTDMVTQGMKVLMLEESSKYFEYARKLVVENGDRKCVKSSGTFL